MTEYDEMLLEAAIASGAAKAEMMDAAEIVLSADFRKICESNSCGCYNHCYACPPDCGDINTLMAKVRSYKYALLYQYIGKIEDSYDIEGMIDCKHVHVGISQKVQKAARGILPGNFLHLSAGGCGLCEKCAKVEGLPCRHPNEVLWSMEGAGIDVYNTSKKTALKYINGENTVTYFGIVLFGE